MQSFLLYKGLFGCLSVPNENDDFTKAGSGFCAFQVQTIVLHRLVQVSERSKRNREPDKGFQVQAVILQKACSGF